MADLTAKFCQHKLHFLKYSCLLHLKPWSATFTVHYQCGNRDLNFIPRPLTTQNSRNRLIGEIYHRMLDNGKPLLPNYIVIEVRRIVLSFSGA